MDSQKIKDLVHDLSNKITPVKYYIDHADKLTPHSALNLDKAKTLMNDVFNIISSLQQEMVVKEKVPASKEEEMDTDPETWWFNRPDEPNMKEKKLIFEDTLPKHDDGNWIHDPDMGDQ